MDNTRKQMDRRYCSADKIGSLITKSQSQQYVIYMLPPRHSWNSFRTIRAQSQILLTSRARLDGPIRSRTWLPGGQTCIRHEGSDQQTQSETRSSMLDSRRKSMRFKNTAQAAHGMKKVVYSTLLGAAGARLYHTESAKEKHHDQGSNPHNASQMCVMMV